jgi:hypothetical protein
LMVPFYIRRWSQRGVILRRWSIERGVVGFGPKKSPKINFLCVPRLAGSLGLARSNLTHTWYFQEHWNWLDMPLQWFLWTVKIHMGFDSVIFRNYMYSIDGACSREHVFVTLRFNTSALCVLGWTL